MTQPKILIASVLKPLKDPRAYYRFGLSLRETNKYQINIIGFSLKKETDEKNIKFTPLFSNSRISFKRWMSHFNFLKTAWKEKPQLCIICTWELLPIACLSKLFLGYKIIYDVQENYTWNITHNQTLGAFGRFFAKQLVAVVETSSKPFVKHYIFSEHCYIHEKREFRPFSVFENRFFGKLQEVSEVKFAENDPLKLLISGTITEVYGIREALLWFLKVQEYFPSISLHIVGHCPLQKYKDELRKIAKGKPGIQLDLQDVPVPYSDILKAYQNADMVLMPYYQLPSIKDKVPSKLYECLAMGKVCLISPNFSWESLIETYPAGISIDFEDLDNAVLDFQSVFTHTFYLSKPGKEVLWEDQEDDFLGLIAQTI